MTIKYTVTRLQEAVEDLRRLEDFCIEREPASETPDWTTPQRVLDAVREGMRLLSSSPYTCRRAELGNGRSRELIVPFGGMGYIVLFGIVGGAKLIAFTGCQGSKFGSKPAPFVKLATHTPMCERLTDDMGIYCGLIMACGWTKDRAHITLRGARTGLPTGGPVKRKSRRVLRGNAFKRRPRAPPRPRQCRGGLRTAT